MIESTACRLCRIAIPRGHYHAFHREIVHSHRYFRLAIGYLPVSSDSVSVTRKTWSHFNDIFSNFSFNSTWFERPLIVVDNESSSSIEEFVALLKRNCIWPHTYAANKLDTHTHTLTRSNIVVVKLKRAFDFSRLPFFGYRISPIKSYSPICGAIL